MTTATTWAQQQAQEAAMVKVMRKRFIANLLQQHTSISAAARAANIHRKELYRHIRAYGMEKREPLGFRRKLSAAELVNYRALMEAKYSTVEALTELGRHDLVAQYRAATGAA